jgi:hypothetical protein
MSCVRSLVSILAATGIVLAPVAPSHAAEVLTRAEYEACQAKDDGAFRTAIEAVTEDALKRSLATFDTPGAVRDAWRKGGVDDILDKRVDLAVSEISKETSWAELLQSLADSQKAQDLAKAVAERVYRSDAIKTAIEGVAVDVGKSLGRTLEFATQDAAGPATTCLKAFLGPRYGSTVADSVTGRAEQEFGIDPAKGKASVGAGAVLSQTSDGIAGAAILLVRRQLTNMAARIGQRIVGSVLSRLVSVAAGGVGAVLIAKDIWELRSGVLPIIAGEMKAKATKDLVQVELARAITDQVGEHVKEVAVKSAARIVDIWQDFRRAHAKAMDIAERSADFRTFLDQTAPARLPRLDEVVGLVLAAEGEPAILKRLADGTLATAINTAPASAIDIARDTRSLDAGLKWAALGGDQLARIVEQELHKRAQPDDFTKASLGRLLAIDDRLAVSRLASLTREARETLFELDGGELKSLSRSLTEAELATLARYLSGLEKVPRERVLRAVAASPAKMQQLASSRVRDGVLASRDQASAVDMMLRADGGSPAEIAADVKLAWEGRVSPMLMWERHPVVMALAIVPVLLFLLLLRRIVMPRRKPAAQA